MLLQCKRTENGSVGGRGGGGLGVWLVEGGERRGEGEGMSEGKSM